MTDPVIVSDTEIWSTSYGPCDGGADMMVTWFNNHKCNRYCRKGCRPAYGAKTEIKATERSAMFGKHSPKIEQDKLEV